MDLKEIYSQNGVISFEVFPNDNIEELYGTLKELKKYNPSLVSLTYGAGGKNKAFSVDILKNIINLGFNVMPHFTCICNSLQTTKNNLQIIEKLGIENILALRGDIPDDKSLCQYDFKYASDLVKFIKSETDLSIGVAGYPETHIESLNLKADIENLKYKADCGANVIYTQLFFDNSKFFKFIETIRKAGINQPVAAGIMPILSRKQIDKMTKLARITVPKVIYEAFEKYDNVKDFGVEFAIKQCQELLDFGVSGLHFYTLNKSYSTSKILENLRR